MKSFDFIIFDLKAPPKLCVHVLTPQLTAKGTQLT